MNPKCEVQVKFKSSECATFLVCPKICCQRDFERPSGGRRNLHKLHVLNIKRIHNSPQPESLFLFITSETKFELWFLQIYFLVHFWSQIRIVVLFSFLSSKYFDHQWMWLFFYGLPDLFFFSAGSRVIGEFVPICFLMFFKKGHKTALTDAPRYRIEDASYWHRCKRSSCSEKKQCAAVAESVS